MGCCLSCRCSCTEPNTFNTIRLVHLNGYVDDFDHPVSVSEVIGKHPKQFLSTAAQLMSSSGSKALNPDTQLQPGHLYFLLPLSTLKDEISPLDMAYLVKRLTARAKSIRPSDHVSPSTSPLWTQSGLRSRGHSSSVDSVPSLGRPMMRGEMKHSLEKSCRARTQSWKPILDTIRELSFTRRNESDLQEMHLITTKQLPFER